MPALDRANIDPTSGALLSGAGADITAIPSAAYTTTGGLGSVTLTIQGRDTTSGKYYTLLAGAAVTSVSTNVYTVAPALTAAANSVANMVVPRTIRVLVTANNANPMTYSVGASVIAA
jgi:hypothetical protein